MASVRKLITGIDVDKLVRYGVSAGGGALYAFVLGKQPDWIKYMALVGGALADMYAKIPFLEDIVKGMIGAFVAEKLSAKTPTPVTIKYVGRKIIV